MNDPDVSTPLTAGQTASLLGISLADLEDARRRREIKGEPFRDVWWQFFPRYHYRQSIIREYERSLVVRSSPLVRMANAILTNAIESSASDVHVEPDRRNLRIRLRINGVLHEEMAIPKHIEKPLIIRYLWNAECSPLNVASPQIGIYKILVHNHPYDVRITSLPTNFGTKLVMRLLSAPAPTRWEELGMSAAQAAQTTDMLQSNAPGLTIFAVPQGEGLTTSFRCALYQVNRPENSIYFLDDIADFPVAGITRVLLDPTNGMTAAEAVKAAKRQGATLIVFGEITDRETARVAIETAESGLPVWAGVRVPDFEMNGTPRKSAQVLWTRFQGFGIAPERVEPVLRGVVMSRLLRTLCPDCKEGIPATDHEVFQIETHGLVAPPTVYKAKGCELCRKTGYRNRIGVFALHTSSPIGYDRSSFAYGAVSRFAAGETDAAELRRLRVWHHA